MRPAKDDDGVSSDDDELTIASVITDFRKALADAFCAAGAEMEKAEEREKL